MFACKHIGDAHPRRAGVILDVMNTPRRSEFIREEAGTSAA
jgi:hypothetical protein